MEINNLLSSIFCFYHPLSLIFLDDNNNFLNSVKLNFFENKNLMMYTDPFKALEQIKNNTQDLLKPILGTDENEFNDTFPYLSNLKISNTLKMLSNRSRFNNCGVLVIDYEMPEMNGVEFCNKIKKNFLFKILLTGEADTETAISAFNKGCIDKFILKSSPYLLDELADAITKLHEEYFLRLSEIILKSCGQPLQKIVNNQSYQKIFHEIKKKNDIVEYYLIDKLGSYLFITENHQFIWLLMSDEEKRKNDVDLLTGYDFPSDIISQLRNQESILYLFSESECKEPMNKWIDYIFPAKKLDNNYSYSIAFGKITGSINWEEVILYADYIKEKERLNGL